MKWRHSAQSPQTTEPVTALLAVRDKDEGDIFLAGIYLWKGRALDRRRHGRALRGGVLVGVRDRAATEPALGDGGHVSARTAVLKIVHPDNGGPRTRRLLEGVASLRGEDGKKFIDGMLKRGELARYGRTKGARYGLPRVRA